MKLATPNQLMEAPELAVLEVLDLNLQQAIFALFAANPELINSEGLSDGIDGRPQVWIADAIYNQASALQYAIDRYREVCQRDVKARPYNVCE